MKTRSATFLTAGLLVATAMPASAQLVIGTADRTVPLRLVDLSTVRLDTSFPVPANVADSVELPNTEGLSVWAMTADEANTRLLFVDIGPLFPGADVTTNLYGYDYTARTPEFLGQIIAPTGFGFTLQGLAATSDGTLYGVTPVNGTPGAGLYELQLDQAFGSGLNRVIPTQGVLLNRDLPGGEPLFDTSSLDYDARTDTLYVVNEDSDAPSGPGLYAYDLDAGSLDFVVARPDYRRIENDIDGLAAGNGRAYFVTDEPGFVYAYDLVNGGDYGDFLSPLVEDDQLFAGAAFAPGLMPDRLAGDANLDGVVDLTDFLILRSNFGTSGLFTSYRQGDFNDDGRVDLADFLLLRGNFGAGDAPATGIMNAWASSIPEPGSAALLAFAAVTLVRRRRV
jgi:hypothetical protein